MNRSIVGVALGCLVACASVSAAEESGAYIGFAVGEASNEVGDFDDSSTTYKALAGYSFNQYFAVELAYADVGTMRDRVGAVDFTNEASGAIASALVRLPLSPQFALYGKLGHAFYDTKATAARETESESEDDLAFGFGLELAVWRSLTLRAEYEAVDVSEGDFEIVSAGVTYKF
jgi:OmpA-OmpF porin, OOP family